MNARLNMVASAPGTRAVAEPPVERFAPRFRVQQGFKGVTFFGNDAVGEYDSVSPWATRADAEAANAALLHQLREAVTEAGLPLQGTPTRRIFEVFEPKA